MIISLLVTTKMSYGYIKILNYNCVKYMPSFPLFRKSKFAKKLEKLFLARPCLLFRN